MTHSEEAIAEARDAMVADLVRRRIIRTPAVEQAFRRVWRHAFMAPPYAVAVDALARDFIETDDARRVYADVAVAIKPEKNTHCLPPSMVGRQIEELAPAEGMRVLHVEMGYGYATALLAELVGGERGSVVATDYGEDIAELGAASLARAGYTTVTVRSGDGAAGVPEAAPFDRIMVSAGAADISPAWVDQLENGGRLVVPLCHVGPMGPKVAGGVMLTVEKVYGALTGRISSVVVLVPLQGSLAPNAEESLTLAEGLQRWFALEDFYRAELPIRIVMKSAEQHTPDPAAVHWLLETRHAVMWVEPH